MFFFLESMGSDDVNRTESLFDTIRHINEYGQEYWSAR